MDKMVLEQLSLVNFKNIEESTLALSEDVNCFVGNNGAGKTNVLDAIYYLSFCKSYFNPADTQNIMHKAPFFVVQGKYSVSEKEEQIYCGLKRQQKKQFKRNKKEYERLSDHIGLLPLVIITPYDIDLIYDGSEVRRKFMDSIISQYDKVYLENFLAYSKQITQRNAVLKSMAKSGYFDETLLSVYDEQLLTLAPKIHEARRAFLEAFLPLFNAYYKAVSGEQETVQLVHKAHLLEQSMVEALAASRDNDRFKQYTTKGPHKDDLTFLIGEKPLKKFGSQGQQKSYLIALKLAQYRFIAEKTGKLPLLLLDDIFDKIDEHRIANLMKMICSDDFGQLFITDTHKERTEALFTELEKNVTLFNVKEGRVEA